MINQDRDEKPLVWPGPLVLGWAVACVAVPWLQLQTVAAMYQCLGVALTFLGLAAVGDRARWAREMTTAALAKSRSAVKVWGVRRRRQLAATWAKLTGKPRSVVIYTDSAVGRASFGGNIKTEVHHDRVDRNTISDREWLAVLDDRVASLLERMHAAEERQTSDRAEFAQRLGVQRDELRAEIRRETRNGWQLVAWGLLYTFIGAALALA